MNTIDVAIDFYPRLANRDEKQGDGKHNAEQFRNKYLKPLDDPTAWKTVDVFIILDFKDVRKIGPSFANEAFAYFTKYAKPEIIREKIKIINASIVQTMIINRELDSGYHRR
jgi:hypothetical protein